MSVLRCVCGEEAICGCNGTLRDAAGAVRFHVYADGSYTRQ